ALGCRWNQSVQLNAPPALGINTSLSRPVCFGQDNGSISISGITGGPGPYNVTLNGTDQGFAEIFPFVIQGLRSGDYKLEIEDQNGCLLETTETILSPLQLSVSLGPDTTIQFGDSIYLVPV
ncbi:MAG: SprB repeat-containing protein, partial [Bacteroidota bacterium]